MTLTEFLLARIAEDEAAARVLSDGYPHDTGPAYLSGNVDLIEVTTGYARVLAECEAKRRIVGRHTLRTFYHPGGSQDMCGRCSGAWPCADLRDLAAVHADHPDYLPEWRP